MHVVPVNGIRNCVPSKVAVPLSEIGQDAPPGGVPVAVATQVTVLPDRVPVAVPLICIVPRHLALNVPDPVVPEIDVIIQ
jgi:hypothetical protein